MGTSVSFRQPFAQSVTSCMRSQLAAVAERSRMKAQDRADSSQDPAEFMRHYDRVLRHLHQGSDPDAARHGWPDPVHLAAEVEALAAYRIWRSCGHPRSCACLECRQRIIERERYEGGRPAGKEVRQGARGAAVPCPTEDTKRKTEKMKHVSFSDRMKITVPEGELDGLVVERFEMKPGNLHNFKQEIKYGRGTRPGMYTRLIEPKAGIFWMSDTDAEKNDHVPAVSRIEFLEAKRVVINGLGLGMVLQAALSYDHVEHVDVVEGDKRVIKLVGPHYLQDPRVTIHHADAYEQVSAWPHGTRWDVGWSDIWPEINPDNLPDMKRLQKAYGRRCRWHRCWAAPEVDRLNRAFLREERRTAEFFS